MSEELVPFGPGELVLDAEVVDGEPVEERNDIRWVQWWNPDRLTTCFRLEVDQSWYQRVPREQWERLNALAVEMTKLVKETTR